jgi:hypothetical protein
MLNVVLIRLCIECRGKVCTYPQIPSESYLLLHRRMKLFCANVKQISIRVFRSHIHSERNKILLLSHYFSPLIKMRDNNLEIPNELTLLKSPVQKNELMDRRIERERKSKWIQVRMNLRSASSSSERK